MSCGVADARPVVDATLPPMVSIPFDTIRAAGTYVCNWNGYLLRVPDGSMSPGNGRVINLVGSEPLLVTRISSDPELPVRSARALASDMHLKVSF